MKKQIRCAIYIRKSTEEGLEQDFNSLDAQREACESYIKSQKHEGLVLSKNRYEDLKIKNILSRAGKPISKANLYRILGNKVYLGKITHKNKVYDAQHTPLVSEELFSDAQNLLQLNAVARKHSTNAKTGTLLAGLLRDDKGNKMCASYTDIT